MGAKAIVRKRIEATFKGTDSLGYINGKRYKLYFQGKVVWRRQLSETKYEQSPTNPSIWELKDNGEGRCVYDTLEGFLDNWTDITEDVTSMRNINIDRILC